MSEQIEKSDKQIKNQIEFWLLKYYGKELSGLDGSELFTLFDLVEETLKTNLSSLINLTSNELPVLLLRVTKTNFVINTTKRFIKIDGNNIESLFYKDFEFHNGFTSHTMIDIDSTRKIADVKTNGLIREFGLRKINGEIILWEIPTGVAGFGFWNVTKKCCIIGRKYK